MSRLDKTIGSAGFDNLFNSAYPEGDVFGVELAAGQGILKRGTLLAKTDGGMVMISAGTTGKANAVLTDDVDTAETTYATAYCTGHFNANALIVAEGYEITAADKEALRVVGIRVSDAVEI